MKEVQAPNYYNNNNSSSYKIFLAGSIEMNTAEKWQSCVINALLDYDVTFLNPRRDDWDSNIEQSKNDPKFVEQVNWELQGLEDADLVVFYFDPNTKSPITLMELGMIGYSHQDLIVCCPEGFYRKGNVDVFCDRNYIRQVDSLEELIIILKDGLIAYL